MHKINIIQPGLYSTIQDRGRYHYRRYGVPVSGAMDQSSADLANLLVKNDVDSPVIEVTMAGPKLQFESDTYIAITGADLSPNINDNPIMLNRKYLIKAGQKLGFGAMRAGVRSYIGIHGLQADKVLGSYSQYAGVTKQSRIEKKDVLSFDAKDLYEEGHSSVKHVKQAFNDPVVEVYAGPEFYDFDLKLLDQIINEPITIKENNRMAYQAETQTPVTHHQSMITSNVVPGTVQFTPKGKLLILMRDAQVTGGYPRIFQLTDQSINHMAQKKLGDRVQLKLIK